MFTFKRSIWMIAPFISCLIGGLIDGPKGGAGVVLSINYLFVFGLIFCFKKNGKRVIENFEFKEGIKLLFERYRSHNVFVKVILPIFICVSAGTGFILSVDNNPFYGLIAFAAAYSGVQLVLYDRDGIVNLLMLIVVAGVSSISADNWRISEVGLIGTFLLFVSVAILFVSMRFAGSKEIWKEFDKEYVIKKLKYLFFIIFMVALFADAVRSMIEIYQN